MALLIENGYSCGRMIMPHVQIHQLSYHPNQNITMTVIDTIANIKEFYHI